MTTTPHQLRNGAFIQNWSGTAGLLIADSWAGIASIVGYRGDGLTNNTSTNPQTTLADGSSTPINLINSSSSGSATGGVHEINDDVVALQGSGTADAPHLVIYLDTTAVQNVHFTATLRELDASTADQKFAVQYRIGGTGNYVNLPAGAVSGVFNAAGNQTVNLDVTLPAAANNQSLVEIRIITNDAVGNDAMVGIDDINVTGDPLDTVNHGTLSIADASVTEGHSGAAAITFTVSRQGGDDGAVSATWNLNFDSADAADFAPSQALTGTVSFADGQTSATITVLVAGDTAVEPDETFTVTLAEPLTGGVTLSDAAATGTILNDDVAPALGVPFINEIHYDNAGNPDTNERIEIAGPAGSSLTGWTLVLYNGSNNAPYATIALSGTFPNQDDGYGTLSFAASGLQNGSPDGVALVAPGNQVIQFLSYEGTMTATSGVANGLTSTDIGVSEDGGDAAGLSLQLTGAGASYADFHWVAAGDDNFGAANTGQDFIGPNATGQVSVHDASIVEGDSGTSVMVFTVTRAGGLGQSAGVDWLVGLPAGGADSADLGPGQPLSGHVDFGVGVSSVQVSIAIAGDTLGEENETFNLLLANPSGNVAIADGSATGTIFNNDPIPHSISEIQGEGHRSPYEGQPVITTGIVTSVNSVGFYLQDPTGDGNVRTSDGIFVFTGGAPAVAVGDGVQVAGTVNEFLPGSLGGDPRNLTTTEIDAFGGTGITVQSHGNALPHVLVGTGGLLPPTSVIDDDSFAVYDPENDGIDFYESLEGMLVTVDAPIVVGNTDERFGETWIVASGGEGATGMNERGGITVGPGDLNPERILLDEGLGSVVHSQGDRLADVTGIMSYNFQHYRLIATEPVVTTEDVTVSREDSLLDGGRDHLTVASYNVENLGPDDADPVAIDKFELIAHDIVYSLSAPDIVALQEVQDSDGAGRGTDLSGAVTAQMLIDAIDAAGGPHYIYVEIPPPSDGAWGGQPGGNIRSGFLFNPGRVDFVEGSLTLIEAPAFSNNVRRPLVGDFVFNGETVTLINVHLTARLGGDPPWGSTQPAPDAADGTRTAQAEAVRAYINDMMLDDPSINVGVLGDFNGFWFENSIGALEAGGVMTDLNRLLDQNERYSAGFEGNLQGIDHIVVTGGLTDGASFDVVHRNAEQIFGTPRGSDHDPVIARFYIEHANEAPFGIVIDDSSVDENAPAGTLVGTVSAGDPDPEDVLAYSLVDDAGGRFAIDSATGALTTTAALDHEAQATYAVVVRVADPDGLFADQAITVQVADVNEAPANVAIDDSSVDENAPAGTLVGTVTADDPDAGDTLAFSLVDDAGGRFAIDASTGALTTLVALDHEAQASWNVIVRATDADGLSADRTLAIGVADVNEAPTAAGDDVAVNEDATTANLWTQLLGNDGDPDAGDSLAIASIDTTGTRGSLVFDAATHTLRYVADHDSFDALAPGATTVDHFTYTAVDSHGLTSTATVAVTVTGIDDGVVRGGGNGADTMQGTAGEDQLSGGNGNDVLFGQGGHDWLFGGNGDDRLVGGDGRDRLEGGRGDDRLEGGSGGDLFVFGKSGGDDLVADFQRGVDKIFLDDGVTMKSFEVRDTNHDGQADTVLHLGNGGSVVLLGVDGIAASDFAGPADLSSYPPF